MVFRSDSKQKDVLTVIAVHQETRVALNLRVLCSLCASCLRICTVPLRCTRLCPHSLDKEDGVERHGPVTLNPRHMRKAFKVMNELRRCPTLSLQLFVASSSPNPFCKL